MAASITSTGQRQQSKRPIAVCDPPMWRHCWWLAAHGLLGHGLLYNAVI